MQRNTRRALVGLLAGLWVASLFLPTIDDWGPGWRVLALGWTGMIYGYVEWFANPLLIVLLLFLYRTQRDSGILAFFAVMLGLLFVISVLRTDMINNEGGVSNPIQARYAGYYMWITAIGAASLLGLIGEFHPVWLGFDDLGTSKD